MSNPVTSLAWVRSPGDAFVVWCREKESSTFCTFKENGSDTTGLYNGCTAEEDINIQAKQNLLKSLLLLDFNCCLVSGSFIFPQSDYC